MTPTPQAIENAARAIATSYGEDADDYASLLDICGPNNEAVPVWAKYVEQAKAALSIDLGDMTLAPKEPTTTMLSAGRDAWIVDDLRRSSTLYRAMIAAAEGER